MKKIITLIGLFIVVAGFSQTKNKTADALFDKMEYVEAAKAYEFAIKGGDNSKETLQRAGDSYYFNNHMQQANEKYQMLISQYPNEVAPEYIFRYAQTLEGIQSYDLAKKWLKNFSKKAEAADTRKENFSLKENTITKIINLEPQFTLQNLSINSAYSDFGPMFYKGQLLYATSIDSSYVSTRKYAWNDQPFLSLQLGKISPSQTDVTYLERFSNSINTKYHEACVTFSPDENTIYFTRNNYNGKLKRDDKGINNLKLYSATAVDKGGKISWENVQELPFNSDAYSVGQPSVSKDGKKLYFISDMPGTIGATDIFVVDILGENKYSQPKNLGEKINTKGREMFPFITDKALYFASDGHLGLGGLDVFESTLKDTIFNDPTNLGAPLNSNKDDFAYIVNEETNLGFVSSNRKTGKGDDDIYSFERIPICKQLIKGSVFNEINQEKIPQATVILYSAEGMKLDQTMSGINGEYQFDTPVDCNANYKVEASKQGFNPITVPVVTQSTSGETILDLGIKSTLIVKENGVLKIKIGIIYFDLNKSKVRYDAEIELNKVVLLMNEYPNMIIKIEAHTDSRANDNYNLILSDKRAKATRDYIISQGIAPERIESAIGYGETQLINNCKNGVPCTDEQHQVNRRSEFIIIKM
ncbi:OmpA family protein [Flavobacterium sp. MC2016-06]|uniref:OmpA family protein n=1 Tax=Flavobacterium sp. MC2016-06 TaxID=2676308 RepID=UPI0012BAC3CF|nr:OmpA family protein [Flavobacterium sp. MC2016-06]MBU3858214.1 OmpA family protein [Flavobacterium sp. MC2016-06]